MRKRRKKRRNVKSIDWMVKSRQMICHIGNALPYRIMTFATSLRVEIKNYFRGKDIGLIILSGIETASGSDCVSGVS
jgi:hypothetical protein